MSSAERSLSPIMRLIKHVSPADVLKIMDVGCGWGMYGFLCRLVLEKKLGYTIQLHGVEIFHDYAEFASQFYDRLTCGDLFDLEITNFDLVLLLDILEHLTKTKACNLLEKILQDNKAIIISTPEGFKPKAERDNNPAQRHVSGFTVKDFTRHGLKVLVVEKEIIAFSPHLDFRRSLLRKIAGRVLPESVKRVLRCRFAIKYFW